MAFSKQSEGMPMQTINLKQYSPFCKEDIFVEMSDEIVGAFLLNKRAEAARDRKMFRYKAFYSLDCNDGIENAAIGWAQPSPEDYLKSRFFLLAEIMIQHREFRLETRFLQNRKFMLQERLKEKSGKLRQKINMENFLSI